METAALQRSEQLRAALALAEASENELRCALDTLNAIKDCAVSLTVDHFDSVSLKQYSHKLKVCSTFLDLSSALHS